MSSEGRSTPGDDQASSVDTEVRRFAESILDAADVVAVEEPLEIQLVLPEEPGEFSLSVTMRTPGDDEDLAAGFLFTEGIIDRASQLDGVTSCAPNQSGYRNVVKATLSRDVEIDRERLTRHVYTTSSCGVCGKTSIDAVRVASRYDLTLGKPRVSREVVESIPRALRASQAAFDQTGGVHAAALFDLEGKLVDIREDVGRHNAVDKVIGAAFRRDQVPLSELVLMVSGRAGFELVQKSVRAGVPIMAAVSAPSSLAVELARESGMTLLAFVREGRFNCYANPERIE
ncbi:MAG: formate dehydrogenase accessory sulfurtransferase FdhD [Thermoanaerobaculia bacterium]|nr:formate dehydrogenase accessory sulfurtransferase FdhD [Thermoanaerobaculia bacterium]